MKRVLVTGATGFIGRNILPLLLAQGYKVHAIAREVGIGSAAITWHQADLLEPGAPSALIKTVRPSHLLHLAWCAGPRDYLTNPANLRWTAATEDLAGAFAMAGGERLVAAGTCAEYASSADTCDERETPLQPSSLYGQAKVAAFERLSALATDVRLSFAWGRIFFPYGPWQAPERLIPTVIVALIRGDRFDCTAGDRVLDFIHVRDVAEAFVAMLGSTTSGAFNVGSGSGVSVRKLTGYLSEIVGSGPVVRFNPKPQGLADPAAIVANTRRLREKLGWSPRISLQEGLTATVDWWRERITD